MFWSGNIALAEGALKAGCNFYAGYPITPSSDLMEYMAREMPKRGGVFIQAEDEIAAINMIIGASIAGSKAMTATSGPGFSLMQEGIGYAVMVEVPIVIVNVMRLGPATGQATKAGQGDIMQARWGRHGDQYTIVLCPSSVKECYYLMIHAFNFSEEIRVPVIVVVDELIAHLWESVYITEDIPIKERKWATSTEMPPFGGDKYDVTPMYPLGRGFHVLYTGSTHDYWGFRKTQDPKVHKELVTRFKRKVVSRLDDVFIYKEYFREDRYDIGYIVYGSVFRPTLEAAYKLREKRLKVGILKLNTLWPLNYDVIGEFCNKAKIVIVPELNLGQLILDVYMVKERENVFGYNKVGGGEPIYPEELYDFSLKVMK